MGFSDTLVNVGAFTGGASQGFGQGLDLAAKYQEIQDKNQARAKRKSLEDFVSQEVERGGFEDPIKGLRATKDFAIQNNMIDEAIKYGQTADELEKSGKQKDGLALFQAVETNPIGAVGIYNDYAKKYGLQPMGPVRLGTDGKSIITTESSGATGTPVERTFTSPDEFKGHILNAAAPMMGFDDAASIMEFQQKGEESEAKVKQAEAAAQSDIATAGLRKEQTVTEGLTQEGAVALQGAQIGSYEASAAASRAGAAESAARAAAIGPEATRQAAIDAAQIGKLKQETQNLRTGGPAARQTVGEVVQNRYKGILPVDEEGMDWPMGASPYELETIANNVAGAQNNSTAAVDAAVLLAQNPSQYDPTTNTVYLPNGQTKQMTPDGIMMLERIWARNLTPKAE